MPKISQLPITVDVSESDVVLMASDNTTTAVTLGQLKIFMSSPEAGRYDLAQGTIEFYKKILTAPLTADMLHEWGTLKSYLVAVQEMAEKYIGLIENEITSKIE
jgi:hypothetical protein